MPGTARRGIIPLKRAAVSADRSPQDVGAELADSFCFGPAGEGLSAGIHAENAAVFADGDKCVGGMADDISGIVGSPRH